MAGGDRRRESVPGDNLVVAFHLSVVDAAEAPGQSGRVAQPDGDGLAVA